MRLSECHRNLATMIKADFLPIFWELVSYTEGVRGIFVSYDRVTTSSFIRDA